MNIMTKRSILWISLITLISNPLYSQDSNECIEARNSQSEGKDFQRIEEDIQKCLQSNLNTKRETLIGKFKNLNQEGAATPSSPPPSPTPQVAPPIQQPVITNQPQQPPQEETTKGTHINPYAN